MGFYGGEADILAVSCDSLDDVTNLKIGKFSQTSLKKKISDIDKVNQNPNITFTHTQHYKIIKYIRIFKGNKDI